MISDFYRKLIVGEVVNSFFIVVTKPLTLINSFVIIGLLSLHDFGVYRLVLSFQSMVSGFSINFLDSLVLNEMNVTHGEKQNGRARYIFKEYVYLKLLVGIALTLGVFFLAEVIGSYYDGAVAMWIRIISFLFVIENIRSLLVIFLQYKLNFFLSSFYSFAYEAVKLILIFLIYTYHTLNVSEVLLLTVFTHLAIIPFMLRPVVRGYIQEDRMDEGYSEKKSLLLELLKKCGSWTISRYYLLNFSQNVRPWIINGFLGTEAVAIFSVALSFLGSLKSFISFNSLKVYLPRELGSEEKLIGIIGRGGRYLTYIYACIFFGGLVAVPLTVYLLFPKYILSLPYFYIISSSMFFFGISTIVGQILYSLRLQRELFFTVLVGLISTAIFSVLLIPFFGLYGVAWEFFFTQFIVFMVSYFFLLQYKPELRITMREVLFFDEYDKILFFRGLHFLRKRIMSFF